MQTLLKCVVAAALTVFIAQSAMAGEHEHRHFSHEKGGKWRTLPLTFHNGDPFIAIEKHKGWKAHFEGPGIVVFKHEGHHHHTT